MSSTTLERPKRTNAPIQPRNRENKMELIECKTCGAHSITNGKCDYCGNQYEVKQDLYDDDNHAMRVYCTDGISDYAEREIFYGNESNEPDFQETLAGKMLLKIMIYTLASIIWFAVTVFIPPLFIITIILLVVYGIFRLTRRRK